MTFLYIYGDAFRMDKLFTTTGNHSIRRFSVATKVDGATRIVELSCHEFYSAGPFFDLQDRAAKQLFFGNPMPKVLAIHLEEYKTERQPYRVTFKKRLGALYFGADAVAVAAKLNLPIGTNLPAPPEEKQPTIEFEPVLGKTAEELVLEMRDLRDDMVQIMAKIQLLHAQHLVFFDGGEEHASNPDELFREEGEDQDEGEENHAGLQALAVGFPQVEGEMRQIRDDNVQYAPAPIMPKDAQVPQQHAPKSKEEAIDRINNVTAEAFSGKSFEEIAAQFFFHSAVELTQTTTTIVEARARLNKECKNGIDKKKWNFWVLNPFLVAMSPLTTSACQPRGTYKRRRQPSNATTNSGNANSQVPYLNDATKSDDEDDSAFNHSSF